MKAPSVSLVELKVDITEAVAGEIMVLASGESMVIRETMLMAKTFLEVGQFMGFSGYR